MNTSRTAPVNRRRLAWLSLLLLMAGGFGCATVMSGRTETVVIDTEPAGADIYLNGQWLGQSPLTAPIPRTADTLQIRKPGFRPHAHTLIRILNPWSWANIPFGAVLPGFMVDYASGSINTFQQDHFRIRLRPENLKTALPAERRARVEALVTQHFDKLVHWQGAESSNVAELIMDSLDIVAREQPYAEEVIRLLGEFYRHETTLGTMIVDTLLRYGYSSRFRL